MAKKILIIDDDETIREMVRLSLELTTRWTICTASTGREGIAVVDAVRPDAILLDVMMPDMDGPAVICRLKGRPGGFAVPVLFLTAKVRKADLRQFKDLGIQGVISKPFDPLKLGALVSFHLAWPEEGKQT